MATHDHDQLMREQKAQETGASDPATPNPASSGYFPNRRTLLVAGTVMSVAMLTALTWFAAPPSEPQADYVEAGYGPIPDFAAIDDIPARKAAFFSFLEPMIEDQNEWILENRAFLRSLRADLTAGRALGARERERVEALATRYGIKLEDGISVETIDELLHRGDVIPPSLVLAQAAKESGWGMSRFAREGHNYFGEWCYTEGCGLVPGRRRPGQSHEVEAFETVEDGVDSYFRNLNRGGPYRQVRAIRAESREKGRPLSSTRLAGGLQKYSERGQVYVDEVRSLIAYNKLTAFDSDLLSVAAATGSRDSG